MYVSPPICVSVILVVIVAAVPWIAPNEAPPVAHISISSASYERLTAWAEKNGRDGSHLLPLSEAIDRLLAQQERTGIETTDIELHEIRYEDTPR